MPVKLQDRFSPPLTNDELRTLEHRVKEMQPKIDIKQKQGMNGDDALFEAAKEILGRTS